MPFARAANFRAPSVLSAALRVIDALLVTVVVAVGLFAALLLLVRFVVFPHIERYRDTIVAAIAGQVHQPVAIAGLSTGWDGWNPKLVIEGLRMGAAEPPTPLLELPRLELTISWTSVPLLDLRLKQLVIDSPRLAVRRDRDGRFHVAGIEIDPAAPRDDAGLTDWLLRQREIVVRNALIAWTDERRDAPQLVLDQVQFRLESAFGRHRFGLTGQPPAELAAPIDLRGELGSASVRDWQHADGKLYVRLDYADLGAWREWLPFPIEIGSGKGALRAWFTFADGQAREVVADVELADVRTRLAPELPDLALAHVSGRAGWRFAGERREVFARQLAFATTSGERLAPTNISLQLQMNRDGSTRHGRLEYDRLELAPMRDLAGQLPLPAAWREDLRRFAPRGTITRGVVQWDGAIEAPAAFDLASDFSDVGVTANGAWPGATGVSGALKASDQGGELKLASREATLRFPHLFAQPIALDTAQGDISWTGAGAEIALRLNDLTFANADAAGHAHGTYRRAGTGPGEIDLDAALTRAAPHAVARYVPTFITPRVRDWLAQAIAPGTVDEAKLKLKGDLAAFPFAGGKGGVFTVDVKGHGIGLTYAQGWPALSDIDGEVHFHGPGLTVIGSRGHVYGVGLGKVSVEVPDLRAAVLNIDGEAAGPTRDFLRFMAESPVGDWTGQALAGAEAMGDGRLALKLALPLHDMDAHRIAGEFRLVNDDLKLPGVPALGQVNGVLAFTEHDLRARELTAQALGGPVKVALNKREDGLQVRASGTAALQAVRREFDLPFVDRISGSAEWTFALDTTGDASRWVVESPLKGAALNFPAPLRKAAADALALRIERPAVRASAGEDAMLVRLGDVAQIALRRKSRDGAMQPEAALVSVGRAVQRSDARRATRPGLWVRAELPELDFDQWLAVKESIAAPGGAAATGLALRGVELDVGALTAFGRDFTPLKVTGTQVQEDWKLELAGEDIAGSATWSAPSATAPNGRVIARLSRFATPNAKAASEAASDSATDTGASAWPELDVAADTLISHGRDLGRMQLIAKPRSGDWRIEHLLVANDAGRVEAHGAWRAGVKPEQTQLDIALDVKDAGAFLTRFGHAGAVQGAPTKITGQLAWAGAPSDFDYPTLSGAFRIEVGSGRFVKVNPGIGKLLGVLSLQALPRRISLDFRDIFSEGFTFDRITGDVRIAHGVMSTEDLHLTGPSAQVSIAGEADLEQETQHLRVRVQPTLTAGVSAGAALLFFANPIVGAAVGAGSLLAQKVLRDPVEQIFSYRYTVSGSWSDPLVARGANVAANAPTEAAKP